jgi:hypothetical protein
MKERQACRVAGVCRGTVRYEPRPDRNVALRRALRRIAGKHRRYGVRRLCILLRRDGWQVNHKRVERLYRQERLILRLKRPKKRLVVCPVPLPEKPNDVWSMDFVHDACTDGRPFRCLTIVDDASRVSPAIEVAHSIPGERVTRILERLAVIRDFREYSGSITVASSAVLLLGLGQNGGVYYFTSLLRDARWRTDSSNHLTISFGRSVSMTTGLSVSPTLRGRSKSGGVNITGCVLDRGYLDRKFLAQGRSIIPLQIPLSAPSSSGTEG